MTRSHLRHCLSYMLRLPLPDVVAMQTRQPNLEAVLARVAGNDVDDVTLSVVVDSFMAETPGPRRGPPRRTSPAGITPARTSADPELELGVP